MEDLLVQIIKEANGNKNKELRNICQQAHDFLEAQQGQVRAAPHELRESCFGAFQMALDSKINKLGTLGISGIQKLLRDDRFYSRLDGESERQWLPSQLLSMIGSINRHSEDVQIELMKVFLNMTGNICWNMNAGVILRILAMCEEAFTNGGSSAIKMACQATACQIVRAYCIHLNEEDKITEKNPYLNTLNAGQDCGERVSSFDNVLPIFNYFIKELHNKTRNSHLKDGPVYFLLESLLSLVSSLPLVAMKSQQLQDYMWKEFCPDLLSLLGSPTAVEKTFNFKSSGEVLKSRPHNSVHLFTNEARHLYSICIELVRLAGSITSLRPMLESVFHRILLYTSPTHRLEALRSMRELFKSPQMLMEFCGPLSDVESGKKMCSSELDLLKLAMDAFAECCGWHDIAICCASVQCVVSLLSSLEKICEGVGLNDDQIITINKLICNLESANYIGPMTYQRWEELQKLTVDETIKPCDELDSSCTPTDDAKDFDSESTLSTEGPENSDDENGNESGDGGEFYEEEIPNEQSEEVAKRRERLPRSLIGGNENDEFACGELYVQLERENAQYFSKVLANHLKTLLTIRSSIALDEALQEFASNYCQELINGKDNGSIIINADGIYLATYSALLLNLKLIRIDFYKKCNEKKSPLNEEEFIEAIHSSGVLVYLSAAWLAELYQIILSTDLLGLAGLSLEKDENCSLVSLLDDLEGSSIVLKGAHLISDYSRLERAVIYDHSSPGIEAGKKLARRILTACWNNMVQVLSALLIGDNAIEAGISIGSALGVKSVKEDRRKVIEAVAASLDGLQRAAKLSNLLNLYQRCESVLYFLVNVSCPSAEQMITLNVGGRKSIQSFISSVKLKFQKLHAAHVQSMDVILSQGLELGSYNSECWQHVLRCCIYLDELERLHFSKGNTNSVYSTEKKPTVVEENSTSQEITNDELSIKCEQNTSVAEVVKMHADSKGVLSTTASLQVLCILSQRADQLFDDAAYKLNLKSLLGFLQILCSTSQTTLFSSKSRYLARNSGLCLVQRISDIMLKCARSGRPLIHVMQCWSIVGLHLIEAASYPDQTIAKKAVAGIHDVVTVLLSAQPEMPHFHFNEALFKPFEKLLCLELCDVDVQDQILMSICEYVEGCTTEIKSGWRPLFGALKAVRPNQQMNYYSCTALDVIDDFLKIDNSLVFCNAVVDCILCLLGHIRGTQESETESSLCLPCLQYIRVTCSHIITMQNLPKCPLFTSSSRKKIDYHSKLVDMEIKSMVFSTFSPDDEMLEAPWRQKPNDFPSVVNLDDLELSSGITQVWLIIFEGLISAATQVPCAFHQQKLDTLFDILKSLFDCASSDGFGLFVINHLLLPSIQDWLRRTTNPNNQACWTPEVISPFKQFCGQSTELVVDYLIRTSETKVRANGVKLMLQQILWLLVECVSQPFENIAKLGCACIRHFIISAGPTLTAEYWEVVVTSLSNSCYISLFHLRQLMVAFKGQSDNFYGDVGQVRVAAKCDCFPGENERLKRLTEQVFQLDNQLTGEMLKRNCVENEDDEDDRSYIILLNPPEHENETKDVVQIQMRSLVVGIVAHQILLQTIGQLLLQGISRMIPTLSNILIENVANSSPLSSEEVSLPGFCSRLGKNNLQSILQCLNDSFNASLKFDARPGLKFLVQKVSRIQGSVANLYKQMGASWTIKSVFLLELFLYSLTMKNETSQELYWVEEELRKSLNEMIDVYSELKQQKNVDEEWKRLQNQPIFFLVAHSEEFLFNKVTSDAVPKDEAIEATEDMSDGNGTPETDNKNSEKFEKVYNVASQKDIDWVVNEYKKRKNHCSMPPLKFKENLGEEITTKEMTTIPTIHKDYEVRVRICDEMLFSIFKYLGQLTDKHFQLLLPLTYPFFLTLVKEANEVNLRQCLVEYLERVACHFGFNYKSDAPRKQNS